MPQTMPRIKPVDGQLQMFGRPAVKRCRRCGGQLHGEQSRERGIGRQCARIESGRLERRVYCGRCGRRLDPQIDGCNGCGNGFETKFLYRVRWLARKRKPKPRRKAH
jgi:hypothetical protein